MRLLGCGCGGGRLLSEGELLLILRLLRLRIRGSRKRLMLLTIVRMALCCTHLSLVAKKAERIVLISFVTNFGGFSAFVTDGAQHDEARGMTLIKKLSIGSTSVCKGIR
jgi:hypothetical protein